MPRWVLVVASTCAFSIFTGSMLMLYPDSVSTVTWHARLVGLFAVFGGLFVAADTIRWWVTRRDFAHWWIGLGVTLAAIAARAPMAISRAHGDRLPWAQALTVSAYSIFLAAVLLGFWVNVVIPDAHKAMDARDG